MKERLEAVGRGLRRRSVMLTLAVAGLFVVGGVAGAAIPDSDDNEIHACYQQNRGELRVIDAEGGAECSRNEKALTFNQQGPQGEQGPRGPSDAFARFDSDEEVITSTSTNLLELNVPDGNFAVTAKLVVENWGPQAVRVACQTILPSGGGDAAIARLEPSGDGADTQTLTMNHVGSSNGPGTIRLGCDDSGGSVRASWMRITAIQVENLTSTPG